MGSIRRHRNAMTALLAEYNDKPPNALDTTEDFDEYLYAKRRREDNDMQSGLCESIIRYARPQKARSAAGEWKYIVNTGQHTQTLRLEKCMNPQESCSYLSTSYRSHCAQVYNYHRLLSWDKVRGLHVDIFKVPTCCSCQIDGFKQQFPALVAQKNNDFTPVHKGGFYRPQQLQQFDNHEEEDDEDDDFDFAIQRKHHSKDTSFDAIELSSNRIKNKVPSPTVGSYLSPPVSEAYEEDYVYHAPRDTVSSFSQQHGASSSSSQSSKNHYLRELQRRRPHQFYKDSISDQDFAPSEQHAERELTPAVAAIATAALRPSQPAPEPFVPSQRQPLQHNIDDPTSLIPMPTKSHQLQQQLSYQQRHQQQPQQESQQHFQPTKMGQHHYRPTITPARDMSSKIKQGFVHHTRSRQPTRDAIVAKRPMQQQRTSSSTKSRLHQPLHRHHRSSRIFML